MSQFNDFAYSSQGSNHIKAGNKPCQDASGSYVDSTMSIIVVADGHGNENYTRTDTGSTFAVNTTIQLIKDFVDKQSSQMFFEFVDGEDPLKKLANDIINTWIEQIKEDVKEKPFLEDELGNVSEKYRLRYQSGKPELIAKAYGTTLIAVCITSDYWFGIQIGDGKCIAFNSNCDCIEPIPWDENCQSNITTSLCDSDAINEFRFFKSTELPLAVFIGSDGIDDSYSNDAELYNLYRSILMIFAEYGCDKAKTEVHDFLPSFSKRGSGDDVSIAGLVRATISEETVRLIKAQIESENATASYTKIDKECVIAREKVEYINVALKKTRETLLDNEAKLKKAEAECDQKEIEKAAAKKRFDDASAALSAAFEAFKNDNSAKENTSQNSKEPTEQ